MNLTNQTYLGQAETQAKNLTVDDMMIVVDKIVIAIGTIAIDVIRVIVITEIVVIIIVIITVIARIIIAETVGIEIDVIVEIATIGIVGDPETNAIMIAVVIGIGVGMTEIEVEIDHEIRISGNLFQHHRQKS